MLESLFNKVAGQKAISLLALCESFLQQELESSFFKNWPKFTFFKYLNFVNSDSHSSFSESIVIIVHSPNTYPSEDNYIIFAQKYYNSTTLSMGVVYTTCASKNSIVSQDLIFYLLWYKVIPWSIHLPKKSYFSFYSFLLKFSEWHRGSVRVKLTKCDIAEWGEKCHYASDILFECPHV